MRLLTHAALALCTFGMLSTAYAGPLIEARVNKIINEVSVVRPSEEPRPAQLNQVVSADMGVKTGVKSRSELLFQDNTLTRIGPDSYFTFKAGTRDITLEEGTMLLQVPKGLGGAKIRTAAVTAAITGTTIMIEYRPKQNIKVLVLEGSLRLSANGRFGDSVLLEAGKMVIMPANARRIPDPVSVDLKKVMKTSSLVNMGNNKKTAALPSVPLIEKAIEQQQLQKDRHGLVDTNLVILGNGSDVILAPDELISALDRNADVSTALVTTIKPDREPAAPNPTPAATPVVKIPQPTATPAAQPSATPAAQPSATPAAQPSATPAAQPSATPAAQPSATPTAQPSATPAAEPSATPAAQPSPTPVAQPSATPVAEPSATPVLVPTPTPAATVTPAPPIDPGPGVTPTPSVEPSASPTPAASASPEPSASPQPSPTPMLADDDEDDDSSYDEVVDIDNKGKEGEGVTVDGAIDLSTGGRSGKVKVRADGAVMMKSTVKVSDSAPANRSSKGGSISVHSNKENGVAITVRNSAQLLSLLDAAAPGPGGKITFRSAGGAVNINGAKIQADRGKIGVHNRGEAGAITVQNATLSANTIKLQTHGKDGELNIGGGTISADSAIDLYAHGSNGQVTFTDDVTLDGASVKTIAGHAVTIANDKTVTVSGSGPANVFTNVPNYTGSGGNGSTTGRFGGTGATTQPFSARPGGG